MSRRVGPALRKSPLASLGGGTSALGPESVPIGIRCPEQGLRCQRTRDCAPAA